MNTTLSTTGALGFSIDLNRAKTAFVPRLINPSPALVKIAFFDPAAGVIWLTRESENGEHLLSVDTGHPTPEFITALNDMRDEGGLPITYMRVEDLGFDHFVEGKSDSSRIGRKVEVMILEQSNVVGFSYLGSDEGIYRYKVMLANGHSFTLFAESDRPPERMVSDLICDKSGVAIDGVPIRFFARHNEVLEEGVDDYAGKLSKRIGYLCKIYYYGELHMNLDKFELNMMRRLAR